MNNNIISDQRYNTAFHEAAHAVMCIMKNVPVAELVIHENAVEGVLGYCSHANVEYFLDNVWIALAGPVADSLHKNISVSEAYIHGGGSDFNQACAELGHGLIS